MCCLLCYTQGSRQMRGSGANQSTLYAHGSRDTWMLRENACNQAMVHVFVYLLTWLNPKMFWNSEANKLESERSLEELKKKKKRVVHSSGHQCRAPKWSCFSVPLRVNRFTATRSSTCVNSNMLVRCYFMPASRKIPRPHMTVRKPSVTEYLGL